MKFVAHKQLPDESIAVFNFEVPTIMGKFSIGATTSGVAMVFFPGTHPMDVLDRMNKYGITLGSQGKQRAVQAGLDLVNYLVGESKQLTTKVDLSFVTPFFRDVYTALTSVPFGETITYGELAALAGHPNKARAVGTAMRNNPAPLFVPCHRVVSASGRLGGWSGPPGWKEWLLKHEKKDF